MEELSREQAMEYLSSVADLESRMYVWKEAMAQENDAMRQIIAAKNEASARCRESERQLKELDMQYAQKEKERVEYNKKMKKDCDYYEKSQNKYRIAFWGLVILNIIVWLAFILERFSVESKKMPISMTVMVLCVVIVVSFWAFPIICYLKRKNADKLFSCRCALNRSMNSDVDSMKQNRQDQLLESYSEAKDLLSRLGEEEAECRKRQEIIFESFNLVKKKIENAYELQILDERYHKFQALYTMYDYLKTGVCLTLYGPGGAIDKYESDLKFGLVYSLLMDIRNIAADMAETQKEIRDYARETSKTLSRIESNTQAIMDYSRETATAVHEVNERLYRIENS